MIIKVWYGEENKKRLEYKTSGSAGLDLASAIQIVIEAGGIQLIPTGVFVAIPEGYEGQIRPRSGVALKHGITVLNSPGTIDSDYREEIGVILVNHSKGAVRIDEGDRIAQLIICKVESCVIEAVESKDDLGTTERIGGFGSTGINE